ncbi:MAG: hypothetical protein ACYCO9_10465 [Streptosporangiaceae bacterium]
MLPGWYAEPDRTGQRHWEGGRWIPGDSHLERGRPAYLWSRRTQVCYDVTIALALAAAAFTILGSASALSRLTSLAAIAQSATHAVKPGLLNLIGPIIVLLALPAHRGGLRAATGAPGRAGGAGRPEPIEAISPQMLVRRGLGWNLAADLDTADVVRFSYRGAYQAGALITAVAWAAALGLLAFSLTSLGDGYTVTSGTILLGMLELAGLIAALAMRPAGLARALVIGQPTQRSSWASRIGTRRPAGATSPVRRQNPGARRPT